jgi:hypothetical protein
LHPRVRQLEPLGFLRDGLAFEETQDHLDRLDHPVALFVDRDAHHHRVGRQQTRADAEQHATARLVVELDDAVRGGQRVVIRQRYHAGTELDALRPFRGSRDEQFRRRNDLESRGVVFADPRFLVTEFVEPLDQLDVAADRQRGVFVNGVERRKENAAAQRFTLVHFEFASAWLIRVNWQVTGRG